MNTATAVQEARPTTIDLRSLAPYRFVDPPIR